MHTLINFCEPSAERGECQRASEYAQQDWRSGQKAMEVEFLVRPCASGFGSQDMGREPEKSSPVEGCTRGVNEACSGMLYIL